MFPNLTTDEVMDLAAKVGARVAREYPGLDADDITSEALAKLVEKADSLKTDDEPFIYKVLYNDGIRYAAKQRYDYMLGTATFIYRPKEVRALLSEAYFDPTMWEVPTAKDDYVMATISKETVGVALMDLQEAWGRLKPAFRGVLIRRFRDEDKDVPAMQVTRAVAALTRYVNGRSNRAWAPHEGPGARECMSSAAGQHKTDADLNAETNAFAKDAVSEFQKLRTNEPTKPAGSYYNWDKGAA